jgi:hypothetical protein
MQLGQWLPFSFELDEQQRRCLLVRELARCLSSPYAASGRTGSR